MISADSHFGSKWFKAAFLMLVWIVLAGCSSQVLSKVWLEPPGWSRGVIIGSNGRNEPAAMQLDENNNIYVSSFANTQPPVPRVQRFNGTGELEWEVVFTQVETVFPTQLKLYLTPGEVTIMWVDQGGLIELTLDRQGSILNGPSVISGDLDVNSFDADYANGALTVWVGGTDDQPGVFSMDQDSNWVLVDVLGSRPDVGVDSQGNLHLAWAHLPANRAETEFVYGYFPGGSLADGRYHVVLNPEFRTTDRIEGPRIALVGESVYIFWTTEIKTGMQAGEIVSSYVTFYQGEQRHFIVGERIRVPGSAGLEYQYDPDDSFRTGPRVAWGPESGGTTQILELTPNISLADQVVLALKARVSYRSQPERGQVGLLFFDSSGYESYQLMTTTQAASVNPTIMSGPDGSLYLSWLEKISDEDDVIYLATTSPDMRAAFNEITSDDVVEMASRTIFGLLSGIAFVPFVLIWLVPPMLLVALTGKLRRPEEEFFNVRTVISLCLGLIGFWLIKIGMVPTMRTVVPFLVWVPVIPAGWQLVLRIGVPSLIAAIGLYLAYRATYGRDRRSPFLFIIIYAIIDGLLTMAVYGYSIMGF